MFSDAEMAVFLEELEEKIQVINDNVLLLEQEGGSPEIIQEMFRAAHTIKGSSGIMGYEKMTNFTHELENLFEQLRGGRLKISAALIDTLFEALDTLNALKDEITGKGGEVEIEGILGRLRSFMPGTETAVGEEPSADVRGVPETQQLPAGAEVSELIDGVVEELIGEAEIRGFRAYLVRVELDREVMMKEVRAYLVFETLQQRGEIIKSSPPVEEIEKGNFDNSFDLILLSRDDADQVKNLVLSIAEVNRVEVVPLSAGVGAVEDEGSVEGTEEEEKEERESSGGPAGAAATRSPGLQGQVAQEIKSIKTVRVDVEKLDTLMNLVGELVIDRTRLDKFVELFEGRFDSDELMENIVEISNHLGQVTNDLQVEIMKARMLPVASVFNRFPRMVRDIAHKMGKEVEFIVEGKDTELDRNVIEVIGDPLIHLLRNAVDHGIEPPEERRRLGKPEKGRIHLRAAHEENHIVITLSDDGRGIDPAVVREKAVQSGICTREQAERMSDREVLDMIFLPGFSTSSEISDISGRGVGMDVVRTQIENINGSVEFKTAPGRGTTFIIKLPLTLAITRALMVKLGGQDYAFPINYLVETLCIRQQDVRRIGHSEVVVVRGQVLPLVRLADIFRTEGEDGDKIYVVVIGSGDKKVGIIVDELTGEQEIVIKSLGGYLGDVPGLAGATILGDGKVALIVDARGLIKELGAGAEEMAYAEAN